MLAVLNRQQRLLKTQLSLTSLLELTLDPLVIVAMLAVCTLVHEASIDAPIVVLALIAFSLSFPGASRLQDSPGKLVREVILYWCALALLLLFFGYASGYLKVFPAEVLLSWALATPLALSAAHLAARALVPRVLAMQGNQRTAVIIGKTDHGARLASQFRDDPFLGVRVLGFFDDRDRLRLGDAGGGATLLGKVGEALGFVQENRVDLIYITLPMATQPRIMALLDDLRDTTASIYFVPDVFVTDLIQGRLANIRGIPAVAVCESPFTGLDGAIKRTSDIVLSLLILVLISPLMLAIAVGVKRSSPGPVLFKQRRYGADGKEIVVYKFRSMTVCEDGERIVQATRNDQRVTRLGAFLRKSSLDELPQFINVLQGRMSIVGPRPHAVAHNELYRRLIKGYMVRHKVKPGITGWAQVSGYRGETDTVDKMQKRIEYDLDYLRNWSLGLDLWIIAKTVSVVLKDRHAY
ncbi:undecaprenyl-phosphate glucose phosphotransferase [Rhodocyclus gracilis]|uniref:undecaprenyl-phosphate glucose phosphotransferase n=1 Tax=Rhodocyclus gracilis TaxID=2929842 RepID=UPI0018908F0E|nr:undecaprenyl-phosphate glucose phosphotransferase [Rhodocyclus gracilis]